MRPRSCSAAARSRVRRLQARPDVVRDVGTEAMGLVEPRRHVRDEPQASQGEEGRARGREIEIDLFDAGAGLSQAERAVAADAFDAGIDPDPRRVGAVADLDAAARPVLDRGNKVAAGCRLTERRPVARSRDRLEHQRDIFGRARHRTGHLQRVPRPVGRMGRDEADRRTQTDDAAERCRDAERTAEIGAFGERNHAGGERRGAAAGRSARALAGVPGIARPAEDFVERVAAGGEFRAVGLAEDDRARVPEPSDDLSVLVGHVVGVDRRTVRGPQRGDRRDVLDADGQSAERPRIVRLAPSGDRARAHRPSRADSS